MNKFKQWMANATADQKKKLAESADTTVGSLRFAAAAKRFDGVVNLTPEFARRIEIGAAAIGDPHLPVLKREDLCLACSTCEYAKQCNK